MEKVADGVNAPSPLNTPVFAERVSFLNRSQWWSREKLEEFQLKQLQHLIWYVKENIPYYKDKLNGVDWRDFKSTADVGRLPTLTKKDIQGNYDAFIPSGVRKKDLFHRSTGGSTGTPLTIYMDLDHLSRDKANTEHYMNVVGFNIFEFKSVRLYGDRIPEDKLAAGEYWYQADERKLIMSCYHITKQTTPHFVEALNSFVPVYIHTRPSAILPLASYILSLNIKPQFSLKGIFCDGEYLVAGQRNMIESAFNTRVYNTYGHTEGCVVGHSCGDSSLLHFLPQIGLMELLDHNGNNVDEENGRGELVVTGFNNFMFPLIRYRTGDVGIFTKEKCPCGRNYPLLKDVEGRIQDYVVSVDNDLIPLAPAVFNYNDFDWKGIKQFQVYQERPGVLLFKIQRESTAQEKNEQMAMRIISDIGAVLGDSFKIDVAFVVDIPRSKIGKLRYLDQQLDMKKFMSNDLKCDF